MVFSVKSLNKITEEKRKTKWIWHLGWTVFYILLAVLYFCYMQLVEDDVICYANTSSLYSVTSKTSGAINVSDDFDLVFTIFFAILCVDVLREILSTCYYAFKWEKLEVSIMILQSNYVAWIVAIVLLHYYRLRHVGRVCSGSYVDLNNPTNQDEYLDQRGKFLFT